MPTLNLKTKERTFFQPESRPFVSFLASHLLIIRVHSMADYRGFQRFIDLHPSPEELFPRNFSPFRLYKDFAY